MKLTVSILCATLLFSLRVAATEDAYAIGAAKPQEGVFILAMGFSATVLELKGGRFRYWFETDVIFSKEPKYPLSGEYLVKGDTITLSHPDVSEKAWTFRTLNGKLTLWRPSAIKYYEEKKALDCYGILRQTKMSAEDAWRHRNEPPKKK